ncbi:extracellular solute-binding protein [Pseudoroseicyclus aestuarii]|uniref:Carbohydrate ABC transporter substrate-binding protein (CUT1 family) n=1 Tax=Pseudoroseicyclus aestuarii TaxID=1795041 RepID=A0A318SWP9_9RHOB|nr:extracellular solute-binding protein [Pseudoroseicyclus aestuarii]PYE85893.1 carbohydrate ABC transporter substrate-binding protein (CUT1 family) [Pseudoroseicyclus aestuarii]
MINLRTTMAASLAALMAMPAAAQETVVWWDFLAGGDGVRMKSLIEQFNEEHPEIQIDGTTLEWGVPFYTKVRTSAAVGQGPDVMTYHLSRLPLALEEGVLSPITDEDMQVAGLSEEDFFPSALEAAKGPDGQLYAVPFDIHSIVLYYNKSYLEGTDYLDENGELTGIDSLESFEAALQAAAANGANPPLSYQTGGEGGVWRIFYTLLAQQGGEFIVDGEVLPGDNADKAVTALQTMRHWAEEGWTPEQAEYEASVALFSSGQSAFQINGVWEVPTQVDMAEAGTLGYEWGAVQVPTLMGTEATWADSHAFAIPVQGDEEMSPEKREAVMTVIGWMEEHAIQWASAGHIPAYRPITESDEYQQMEPNATYASLADTAVFDPRDPIAGVASPVYDQALNIMVPAIAGYLSPEDAVAQMQSDLSGMMQ